MSEQMLDVTVTYELSEIGQRELIRRGGDGKAHQALHGQISERYLDKLRVLDDGTLQYQAKALSYHAIGYMADNDSVEWAIEHKFGQDIYFQPIFDRAKRILKDSFGEDVLGKAYHYKPAKISRNEYHKLKEQSKTPYYVSETAIERCGSKNHTGFDVPFETPMEVFEVFEQIDKEVQNAKDLIQLECDELNDTERPSVPSDERIQEALEQARKKVEEEDEERERKKREEKQKEADQENTIKHWIQDYGSETLQLRKVDGLEYESLFKREFFLSLIKAILKHDGYTVQSYSNLGDMYDLDTRERPGRDEILWKRTLETLLKPHPYIKDVAIRYIHGKARYLTGQDPDFSEIVGLDVEVSMLHDMTMNPVIFFDKNNIKPFDFKCEVCGRRASGVSAICSELGMTELRILCAECDKKEMDAMES